MDNELKDQLMVLTDLLNDLGKLVTEDDAPDIGKFDRIHHWQIGVLLQGLSKVGQGFVIYDDLINGVLDED